MILQMRTGIAGASGYAGAELVRLIEGHPAFELAEVQARSGGFDPLDVDALIGCDIAFLALPHGASGEFGTRLASAGTPVVDLGSDFRLDPGWVYGLPELNRDEVRDARRIANPGCYATAAILALAPLAEAALISGHPVIDGKSGVSGAGREPSASNHISEAGGGVQPYTPTGHRHIAEIERTLGSLTGSELRVTFTPHLVPISRGLEVSCYVQLARPITQAEAEQLYRERYAGEPFALVTQSAHPGELHGANACHLGIFIDERTNTAIAVAAIDNLVKGAAGQAIQNANLMLGLEETLGLTARGLRT